MVLDGDLVDNTSHTQATTTKKASMWLALSYVLHTLNHISYRNKWQNHTQAPVDLGIAGLKEDGCHVGGEDGAWGGAGTRR